MRICNNYEPSCCAVLSNGISQPDEGSRDAIKRMHLNYKLLGEHFSYYVVQRFIERITSDYVNFCINGREENVSRRIFLD
jgi:hypothetical protein